MSKRAILLIGISLTSWGLAMEHNSPSKKALIFHLFPQEMLEHNHGSCSIRNASYWHDHSHARTHAGSTRIYQAPPSRRKSTGQTGHQIMNNEAVSHSTTSHTIATQDTYQQTSHHRACRQRHNSTGAHQYTTNSKQQSNPFETQLHVRQQQCKSTSNTTHKVQKRRSSSRKSPHRTSHNFTPNQLAAVQQHIYAYEQQTSAPHIQIDPTDENRNFQKQHQNTTTSASSHSQRTQTRAYSASTLPSIQELEHGIMLRSSQELYETTQEFMQNNREGYSALHTIFSQERPHTSRLKRIYTKFSNLFKRKKNHTHVSDM